MTRSERLRSLVALTAMLLSGAVPAMAGAGTIIGPAAGEIGTYLKETPISCFTPEGKDATCAIADIGVVSRVDYGAFTDRKAPAAVAFVSYRDDPAGRMVKMMAIVFRESGGRWVPVGRAMEILGRNPHAVRFGPGTILYEGGVVSDDGKDRPVQRSFVLTVTERAVRFTETKGEDRPRK